MPRFKNYFNKKGKHNRIYSMDELYKMNLGDFIDREEELDYQDRTIGLPYDDELKASSNVRYIDGFTQDDGNVIPSRWESFVPEENFGNVISMQDNQDNVINFPLQNAVRNQEKTKLPDFSNIPVAEPKETIQNVNGQNNLEGNKKFNVTITNTSDVIESEPDENLDKDGIDNNIKTSETTQKQPTTYWDSKGNIHKIDENGNEIKNDKGLWNNIIGNKKKIEYNIDSWLNKPSKDMEKVKTDIALDILTMPLGLGEKLNAKLATKLIPFFTKKIAQRVAKGIGNGAVGGTTKGIIHSIENKNDKNPLITVIEDIVNGVGNGAINGYTNGTINNSINPNDENYVELLKKLITTWKK